MARSRAITGLVASVVTLLATGVFAAQDAIWKGCELGARNADRSIAACSKLLKRPSSRAHAAAFHHRALAFEAKGKLDQAISDVSAGIRLDPQSAYRWQKRGELYARQDKYKQAVADLTEAIRKDPTPRAFRFEHRAEAYKGLGDFTHAIADFDEAIRLDPVARTYRFRARANALRDAGQYDRALADYETALKLEPTNTAILVDRGRTYAKMGRSATAKSDFGKAQALDPSNAELRHRIGVEVAALPGQSPPSAVTSQKTLPPPTTPSSALKVQTTQSRDPQTSSPFTAQETPLPNAETYVTKGRDYFNKGDFDRAMAEFNRAIQLDPKNAGAYNGRGAVYSTKGDNSRAMDDFNHAIQLDPKLTKAYVNRGVAYANKGDTARAITDYNKAILLDPKFAQAYINRGLAYSREGNINLAKADFTQATKLDPKITVPTATSLSRTVTAPYVLENPYGWACPPPYEARTSLKKSQECRFSPPSTATSDIAAACAKNGESFLSKSFATCREQFYFKRNQAITEAAQSAADWEAAIAERKQSEQDAARHAQELEQEQLAARQAEAAERAAEARKRYAEDRQRAAEAKRQAAEAALQERQRAAEVRQRAVRAAAAAQQRAAEEERRAAEAEARAAEADGRAAEAERRATEKERAKREAEARRQQAQREAELREMHQRGIFGVESLGDIVNAADHNTVRFERDYKGKTFSGVGAFNEIGKANFGFGNSLAINLFVGNRKIVCFIDKSNAGAAADWRAGSRVRFTGTISTTALLGETLQLQDCTVTAG